MRNANVDDYEAIPRPIISVGNDYAPGIARGSHQHRRNQLLYGATGLMIVTTPQGRWVVPPQRALWIPAGVYHAHHNCGTEDALFISMPTRPYNHLDPDVYRLPVNNDVIPYRFENTLGR